MVAKTSQNQKGIIQLPILFSLLVFVGGVALFNLQITTKLDHSNSRVQGVFLAKGDDDGGSSGGDSGGGPSGSLFGGSSNDSSGGSSGGGSNGSGSGGGSGGDSGGNSPSGGSNVPDSIEHPQGFTRSQTANVAGNALVECVGPDGKHIQVPLQACSDLNKIWHNDNFSFKVVNSSSQNAPIPVEKEKEKEETEQLQLKAPEIKQTTVKNEDEAEVEIENEIEKVDTEVKVKESDGSLEIEAKDATVSGLTSLATKNNLKQLKFKIKQGSAESEIRILPGNNGIKLADSKAEASTKFPISLDPKTGQLQVATPNGIKPIRILPSQASSIAQSAGLETQIERIELVTNTNSSSGDDAIFQISGVKSGKLLGLIPVSGLVETEIGAQTSTLLNVKQPLWLKILGGLIR